MRAGWDADHMQVPIDHREDFTFPLSVMGALGVLSRGGM